MTVKKSVITAVLSGVKFGLGWAVMVSMARDIKKTVIVDLDRIIECDGVDGFNDYLCELVGESLMMDIGWTYPEIKLVVTGYVEDEEDW